MTIRKATESDIPALAHLLRDTILRVNIRDYSAEQVKVWAAVADDVGKWKRRLSEQYFIVAVSGDRILGLASLEPDGYLDMMYVDADHQGLGVGANLLNKLMEKGEEEGLERLHTQASITAQPFFEHHGFVTVRRNEKTLAGTAFINYIMERKLA